MDEVTTLVARQYETFPYPQPLDDIDRFVAEGCVSRGDPALYGPAIWPEGKPVGPLRILVAGCGSSQAAYAAYMNRTDKVTGIDLSETSIGHERSLKKRHGLVNLELHRGDLLEAGNLGEPFDVIICSGVLHHMADPNAGLRVLRDVLHPEGVMVLMVYGQAARVGVYMLQDAFRRMGLNADSDGIAKARSVLAELPDSHCVRPYVRVAKELQHDNALVDTFLHPQDRAYTVPQVFDFLESAGLRFESWVDNAEYWRNLTWGANSAIAALVDPLPPKDHWSIIELLRQRAAMHHFTARHQSAKPQRAINFHDEDWRSFTPHRSPELMKTGPGQYQRYLYLLSCAPVEEFIIDSIDGKRTIGEILSHSRFSQLPADQLDEVGRTIFENQWKLGHIMVSLPPQRAA